MTDARGISTIHHVLEATPDLSEDAWASTWLEANGLPNPRAEAWLYTPLDTIEETLAVAVPAAAPLPDTTTLDATAGRHGRVRIVFVDGRYSPELSDTESPAAVAAGPLPPGVVVQAGDPGQSEDRIVEVDSGLVALNAATRRQGAVVRVPAGVAVGCGIHVVHLRTASGDLSTPTMSAPMTTIELGDGASAQVIESQVSLGAGITNAVTRITIGADAHLTHVRLQDEHLDAVHVGQTDARLHSGAHLESASLSIGAGVARNAIDVHLDGSRASTHLSGLSMLGGTQRHDTVLRINHTATDCRSDQDFRSVVDDRARSSFLGHVKVAHGASGSDASQSNRNLLLSRTAQADTRPWLEILTDDVKCNHGATVGRLDDDALFYLRSRGIPAARAASMLVAAFAAELTDRLEPESLRHTLDGAIGRLDPAIERVDPEGDQGTSEG